MSNSKASAEDTFHANILVIDDDAVIRRMARIFFEREGHVVFEAESGQKALEALNSFSHDVILLDVNMPGMNGFETCHAIRKLPAGASTPILLVTASADSQSVEKGFASGATDYITKPINWPILRYRTLNLARASRAEKQVISLKKMEQVHQYTNDLDRSENLLIGDSPAIKNIRYLIKSAADSKVPVLITGETGTGKNVVAKSIHHSGERRDEAFINVNCAALPESLIEAELFGVEKGAYTGAVTSRKGTFELADGGTLFLDEIGEMPFTLQSKLLSVLEEGHIKRIGSEAVRKVDVRIISATNIIPEKAIQEKRFRKDLYYRLGVLCIEIPPLRERKEDIPNLLAYFVRKFAPNRNVQILSSEVESLKNYSWPGNVREMRNIIERCLILQQDSIVYPSLLLGETKKSLNTEKKVEQIVEVKKNLMTLQQVEREHIQQIFVYCKGNQTHTAKILDISLTTLKRKLKEYRISNNF